MSSSFMKLRRRPRRVCASQQGRTASRGAGECHAEGRVDSGGGRAGAGGGGRAGVLHGCTVSPRTSLPSPAAWDAATPGRFIRFT